MLPRFMIGSVTLIAVLAAGFVAVGKGWLGRDESTGEISGPPVPAAVIEARGNTQRDASRRIAARSAKQILFGDLHVHTTFSFDAFIGSLPMMQGEGVHPLADACDFARYCSALDFWSINDHAESSTPRRWRETVETIQQCNAVNDDNDNPDTVAFLGWEWSQVGATPEQHFGHRNVIFRDIDDSRIPSRPIHSGGLAALALKGLPLSSSVGIVALDPGRRTLDFARFLDELRRAEDCPDGLPVRELPGGCRESAATPAALFAKLDDWGFDSIVIPHGTTWGFYTPAGASWDKQLAGAMHDPERQTLIEVFSGHGNSEEYRTFRAAVRNDNDQPVCPAPTKDYLPSCHRAGEIVRERCLATGAAAPICEGMAADARQNYINAGSGGHLSIRGESAADWLNAGQCQDCYMPAFNYRPGGAVQYIMALRNFDDPAKPRRFRFGFIASSDVHKARPGTGYKEFFRQGMTESAIGPSDARAEKGFREAPEAAEVRSYVVDYGDLARNVEGVSLVETRSPVRELDISAFMILERERQASFFGTGGLIAAHANGRTRDAVWDSLQRKEVYGTSGDRILLWFDLVNAAGSDVVAMGGETAMKTAPEFEVRAIGAFEQLPGCPDYAVNAMPANRLDDLCRGECFNPSDTRKPIIRIEVVRILPQAAPGEDISALIQDPWATLPCPPGPDGCTVRFRDDTYDELQRDAVYYVRAIQAPSLAINADNLRCDYDDAGNCIRVNPCYGGWQTPVSDDCLAAGEERAWSSPIFIDWLAEGDAIAGTTKMPAPGG